MRNYFEAEMRLLHESAQEFAKLYPEQAGMLNLQNLKQRDPYVERLLEGFAYLSAQLRQRIDDDLPDITETLINQLNPQLARPIPAMTIAQFNPHPGQLQQTYDLAKGAEIYSQAVGEEQTVCRFRTVTPNKINPLSIIAFTTEEPASGGTCFKLRFQVDNNVNLADLDLTDLRLFLHADPSVALQLLWALTGKARQVRVLFPQQPEKASIRLGSQEVISICHLECNETLLPTTGRCFQGFNLLIEYFAFKEKHLFVTIKNLQHIPWAEGCKQFEIEIYSDLLMPAEHRLSKENFQLNCVPAVNLFNTTSEPIRVEQTHSEYVILADTIQQESINIYSIDNVTGINTFSGMRTQYAALNEFDNVTDKPFYQILSRDSGGHFPQHRLILANVDETTIESISCEITASNGFYPHRYLREYTLTRPSSQIPAFLAVTNLTRPTSMLTVPKRKYFQWNLLSHMSLNYRSLSDLNSLRELLSLYDFSDNKENQRKVDAIENISVTTESRVKNGGLMHGLNYEILLMEEGFRSLADVYLFGCVLHQFLNMFTAINSFVETKIICHPSNKEITWTLNKGTNQII